MGAVTISAIPLVSDPRGAGNPAPTNRLIRPCGSEIAVWRTVPASGSPLLLVHGSAEDHSVFDPVVAHLPDHQIIAIDRRGHGASSARGGYSLQVEAEDIAATIAWAGSTVTLIGLGYGALCALEAARLTDRIDHLILFEPPIERRSGSREADIAREIARLADIGDAEHAAELHLRLMARAGDDDIAAMKADGGKWESFVAGIPVLARELVTIHDGYRFDAERFRTVDTWITLLIGRETDPIHMASGQLLAAAAPSAIIRWIAGASHRVTRDDPGLFAGHLRQAIDSQRNVKRPIT